MKFLLLIIIGFQLIPAAQSKDIFYKTFLNTHSSFPGKYLQKRFCEIDDQGPDGQISILNMPYKIFDEAKDKEGNIESLVLKYNSTVGPVEIRYFRNKAKCLEDKKSIIAKNEDKK